MGWLQASERPRRPPALLRFEEASCSIFVRRLVSGLEAKLEGQYGALWCGFGGSSSLSLARELAALSIYVEAVAKENQY